jgi:hypothetical protein
LGSRADVSARGASLHGSLLGSAGSTNLPRAMPCSSESSAAHALIDRERGSGDGSVNPCRPYARSTHPTVSATSIARLSHLSGSYVGPTRRSGTSAGLLLTATSCRSRVAAFRPPTRQLVPPRFAGRTCNDRRARELAPTVPGRTHVMDHVRLTGRRHAARDLCVVVARQAHGESDGTRRGRCAYGRGGRRERDQRAVRSRRAIYDAPASLASSRRGTAGARRLA